MKKQVAKAPKRPRTQEEWLKQNPLRLWVTRGRRTGRIAIIRIGCCERTFYYWLNGRVPDALGMARLAKAMGVRQLELEQRYARWLAQKPEED
jgi:hypothetical protein